MSAPHPISSSGSRSPALQSLNSLIFLSRWLQAPLYLGLIVAQAVYVYQFMGSCGTWC